MSRSAEPPTRCPVCSRGTIADIDHDVDPARREPVQRSDSRELVSYSCGHQVLGASIASADTERLTVERRTSDESVDPETSPQG